MLPLATRRQITPRRPFKAQRLALVPGRSHLPLAPIGHFPQAGCIVCTPSSPSYWPVQPEAAAQMGIVGRVVEGPLAREPGQDWVCPGLAQYWGRPCWVSSIGWRKMVGAHQMHTGTFCDEKGKRIPTYIQHSMLGRQLGRLSFLMAASLPSATHLHFLNDSFSKF